MNKIIGINIHGMQRSRKGESAEFLSKLGRLFTYEQEEEDTKSIIKEMNDTSNSNAYLGLDFAAYEKRRYDFQANFLEKVYERITLGNEVADCFMELISDVPSIAACMNEEN